MLPKEYSEWLANLPTEEYDALVQERITRLNNEQQVLVQARIVRQKERGMLYEKLATSDPQTRTEIINTIKRSEGDCCEHGRSWVKHCLACGEIDYLMFPEMFDTDGFPLGED